MILRLRGAKRTATRRNSTETRMISSWLSGGQYSRKEPQPSAPVTLPPTTPGWRGRAYHSSILRLLMVLAVFFSGHA
jgi:hypothetical protein